jgi:hypothetical protein
MTQSELTKQPFFVRFMETQNKQTNVEGISADSSEELSDDAVTLKFPSDWDDADGRPF